MGIRDTSDVLDYFSGAPSAPETSSSRFSSSIGLPSAADFSLFLSPSIRKFNQIPLPPAATFDELLVIKFRGHQVCECKFFLN